VQILLTLSSKNVRGPAARSTEYGGRSAESMRFMRSRIALSVWRLDNSAPTPPAYNYPDPRSPFHSLFIFAPLHRSSAPICTFARLSFRTPYSVLDSVLCTLISTFPQALGRFALLHCYLFLHASPRSLYACASAFRNSAIAALPASIAIALASVTELRCA